MAYMEDFLCLDFLFAVISMFINLLYMGRTETCPFVRDPFSRGDMAREGLAF